MSEPLDTARRVNRGDLLSAVDLHEAQHVLAGRSWLHRAEVEQARRRVEVRLAELESRAPAAPRPAGYLGPANRWNNQPLRPADDQQFYAIGLAREPGLAASAEDRLAKAWASYDRAEARMYRGPETRVRLEKLFLIAAEALANVGSPQLVHAWRGVALTRRYQKGRSGEALEAYRRALAADPGCEQAVDEYLDFMRFWASAAGLTEALLTIPQELRCERMPLLINTARGQDQWGNMPQGDGARWIEQLADVLRGCGDLRSLGWLFSMNGLKEEQNGSHDKAVGLLREALATGHATVQAVDRLTVRMVADQEWSEAAEALSAALTQPIASDTLRHRMVARLRRCERQLTGTPDERHDSAVPPGPLTDGATPADVRTWARNHGYEIRDRGRLPSAVVAAYHEAHQ